MNQMVTIEKSGHLVIPVEYRKALRFKDGEAVMLSLKEGHIEISSIQESIAIAQDRVKKYLRSNVNLVEMLFDDRKEGFS
jgi:AbrB family looped-hinge helix DNA binding protein